VKSRRRLTAAALGWFALAVVARAGAAQTSPSPAISDGWRARVESFAKALRDAGFNGVVLVRVASAPPFIHGVGFADSAQSVAIDENVAFDIGSVTKQFTAAAVLRLASRSALSLQDSIGRHFSDVPAEKRGITIHQLLTHTAGLPEAIGQDYERISRPDYVRRAMATPLRGAPGAQYRYSNVGYSLLAAIVEQRSGMTLDEFLQRQFFVPAGMRSTGYRVAGLPAARIATGFAGDRHWGRPTDRPWDADGPFWNLRGNGGILSTAMDMLRWHDALESGTVFSPAELGLLYGRHTEEGVGAGTYYGYGWALFPTKRGTTLVTHNGGNGVFFADVLRFRDERVFVFVASNRMRREFRDVGHTIARLVFDSTFTATPPAQAPPAAAFTGLPQTDVGRLAQRLLTAVSTQDAAVQQQLVTQDYAASLRNAAPMDRHLAVLARLRASLGANAVVREVVVGEEELRLTIHGADGARLGVLLMGFTRGPDRPRISGIGFED